MKNLIAAGILGLTLVATGSTAAFAYHRDYNARRYSSFQYGFQFEDDFWGSRYGNYWSYRYWWF